MIKKSRVIVVLIIFFFAILLSLPIPVSRKIKIELIDFLSPLIRGSNYLIEKIFSVKDLFTAIRENKTLRKDLNELTNQLNQAKEIIQENQRLRQLLDLKKSVQYETIACRVIARDAGTWYKTLVIDKGKMSGVNIDMPVLSLNGGVAGRVIDSTDGVSRVLLITDVNSSIGAVIQDTRIVGLVEGDGRGGCLLNLIPKNIDIQTGAVVVTSGLGEIYPKGLPLGTITDVFNGNQGLHKMAKLKLCADIDRIEEVLVIKKFQVPNSSKKQVFESGKSQVKD